MFELFGLIFFPHFAPILKLFTPPATLEPARKGGVGGVFGGGGGGGTYGGRLKL